MEKFFAGLKNVMVLAGAVSLLVSFIGWMFLQWSEWSLVPDRLERVEMAQIEMSKIVKLTEPEIVTFKGRPIALPSIVKQGEEVTFTYLLRRHVSCETIVNVQWFDLKRNNFASPYSATVRATKSAVTLNYNPFSLTVKIPSNLPPGTYSYAPILQPVDCGVYKEVAVPMSDPIVVVAKDVK